ncbi:hypothetical protein ACFW6V_32290 [Streptomyces sp. NPDC058734]|uniref:hypothetical protein n=1 Tax=Streptomyces sp. NPDC058734 TaxID=3346615 RepID=UPI0036AA187C
MLVREALRRRFTALPEPAQGVLRLCAAVSTEVDTGLPSRTAAEGGPVATALDAAVRAGPLGADPHAPGRLHVGTLLDELPHGERVPLHSRVTPGTRARGHGRTGGRRPGAPPTAAGTPRKPCRPPRSSPAEQAEQRLAHERVETRLRRAVGLTGGCRPATPRPPALGPRPLVRPRPERRAARPDSRRFTGLLRTIAGRVRRGRAFALHVDAAPAARSGEGPRPAGERCREATPMAGP